MASITNGHGIVRLNIVREDKRMPVVSVLESYLLDFIWNSCINLITSQSQYGISNDAICSGRKDIGNFPEYVFACVSALLAIAEFLCSIQH